jgi:hypothetical protein
LSGTYGLENELLLKISILVINVRPVVSLLRIEVDPADQVEPSILMKLWYLIGS